MSYEVFVKIRIEWNVKSAAENGFSTNSRKKTRQDVYYGRPRGLFDLFICAVSTAANAHQIVFYDLQLKRRHVTGTIISDNVVKRLEPRKRRSRRARVRPVRLQRINQTPGTLTLRHTVLVFDK